MGCILLNWDILTEDEKEDVGSFLKRIDEKTGESNFEKFENNQRCRLEYLKENEPDDMGKFKIK